MLALSVGTYFVLVNWEFFGTSLLTLRESESLLDAQLRNYFSGLGPV